ncbi:MAG: adenylate/guanylate cyclase domain-containing protein [archaeon]|nr:adenylate/guanylate cyclase domain-containing protein [archaeon]
MEETEQQRKLAAIMFTDIVGYTALAQRNETLALQRLAENRKILRSIFPKYNGIEVKTIGDAFLLEFSSALEAVHCAVAIQRELEDRRKSLDGAGDFVQVRIGIHIGDVVHSENDIYGDAVNVASRIEPLAEPGGICLSDQVFEHVRNKIECPIVSLGRKELKNVQRLTEVYKVVTPWEKDASKYRTTSLDRNRIAILPMSNMSPDPGDEYFSDGMTEEMISAICTISSLKVISRTSAMKYKGTSKSIPEIGRELNVGSILEGSVRKAGSRVRISVQLIDVCTDEHSWSQTYDRELEDVFAIQSDIAKQVASALKVNLLSIEKKLIEKQYTHDTEAHNLYLKGRFHWHNATEAELNKAIEYFKLAIERDAKFSLAYVGMADSYIELCSQGCLDSTETLEKAKPLVMKALELDDLVPEAHATLATLLQDYDWDWDGAERRFKRAIELNPNWSVVCHSYAVHLALRGRFDQAIAEIKHAEELDPFDIGIHDCAAETYRVSNQLESAINECEKELEIDPKFVPAHIKLGKTYLQKSLFEEGVSMMQKAVEMSGGSALGKAYLAYAYGVSGSKEEAKAIINELVEMSKKQYVSAFNLAVACCGLGDKEATIEWLEKAFDQRAGGLFKINVDPMFDSLRDEPRFQELVRKIGLSKSAE